MLKPLRSSIKVPTWQTELGRWDEGLWNEFEWEFTATFTADTTRDQEANNKLMSLQRQGNDINMYISTFNHLVTCASWLPNDKGTLEKFKRGPRRWIVFEVPNRENPPTTLTGRQDAAQKEVLRHAQIFADLL